MSTNEVGSISNQQIKTRKENPSVAQSEQPTIEVFASDNVSARVNLTAEEGNSLFTNTTLNATAENGIKTNKGDTTQQMLSELPEDIKQKYPTENEQNSLKTLTEAQLEQARKLFDTKIPAQNIVQIVRIFKPEQVDTIKRQAEEMEELSGGKDKVFMMAVTNDSYDKSAFNLTSLDLNMNLRTNVLNSDLTVRSIEQLSELTTQDGKKYREREAYDLKTNTVSKTRFEQNENGMYVASYEIRSKIKDDGSMISREYIRPSKVAGMYDVDVLTENGTEEVSKTKQKKNGKTTVRRNMESPDGTKTEYLYRDDPKGNRYSRYKITDADGNVLMNNTKTFKVIDDSTFQSTFNDKSYTMTINENILTVQNDNDENETAQIDLSQIQGNKDALIPILKQMSGDQLIALSKTTDKLVGIDKVIESYYSAKEHVINSGEDMFVVLHEEGHSKDFQTLNIFDPIATQKTMISRDKELTEIFDKEKNSFYEAFPDAQREHVDYFTNILTHYGGNMGGIQETVAESNAILETPRSHKDLGLRSQYLQQYFPKTIARLNTLLSENRERAEQKIPFNIPKLNIPKIPIPTSIPTASSGSGETNS